MSLFDKTAFKRGAAWADRRRELKAQRLLTAKGRHLKETLLLGQLKSRAGGVDVPDELVAQMMTDWLIIHEAMEGE